MTSQYNTYQLIEEFKVNGFVVLEDFIPIDTLEYI